MRNQLPKGEYEEIQEVAAKLNGSSKMAHR
jgi:hypothetical protein